PLIGVEVGAAAVDDGAGDGGVEGGAGVEGDVEPGVPLHAVVGRVAVHATEVALAELGQPELLGDAGGRPAQHGADGVPCRRAHRGGGPGHAGVGVEARLQSPPEVHNHVGGLVRGAVLPRVTGGELAGGVARVVDVGDGLPVAVVVVEAAELAGQHVDLPGLVPDQRARVGAVLAHSGVGHADVGQDVVAPRRQVDVAVAVPLPVAGGLAGDDRGEEVGGDAPLGRRGVDEGGGGVEHPAREAGAGGGEGGAHLPGDPAREGAEPEQGGDGIVPAP